MTTPAKPEPKFHLVLIIHAHQPCGNFEHVFEECYEKSYDAFLKMLEAHAGVRAGLHYSGPLLLWIAKNRPEYFERLRELVEREQVEILGGGFYEPILVSIPPADQLEQMNRLNEYIEAHFGQRPKGAWLTERVWEPQLPSALAAANLSYTLVDDLPFLAAGFTPEELYGPYIAEDRGRAIWVFPGLKDLRYLIPFRKVEEVTAYLKDAAVRHPGGAAAFGDDMEKFGVWPGTFEHCYTNGWLEEFFAALEANSDWLTTSTPSQYLGTSTPLGRADLPTASYSEMMEWVLPTETRLRYLALQKEFQVRPDVLTFLRGGPWRGFLRKYPESNLLHKKMLRTSAAIAGVPPRRNSAEHQKALEEARDLLLRAQSNDAYWHGVFGGLYAPHLRTEISRSLIRAETLADQLSPGGNQARVEFLDYDADGKTELLLTATEYQAVLQPADGGTMSAFDFRPTASSLINSIMRRPEAYHTKLKEGTHEQAGAAVSIHDQVRVKEPGLEKFLRYDKWARYAFRLLFFDANRTQADYEQLRLGEWEGPAGAAYEIREFSPHRAMMYYEGEAPREAEGLSAAPVVTLSKEFLFSPAPLGCEVSCDVVLEVSKPLTEAIAVGIESVINLLAPTEGDRFFETPTGPQNLRFSGSLPAPLLRMQDGWQGLRVTLHAPQATEYWVAPIETVSDSEGGFERVYQGSQILAVWRPDLQREVSASFRLIWRVETL